MYLVFEKYGLEPLSTDYLKPGKIEALKMLDLQTKSAIKPILSWVMIQATNQAFKHIYPFHRFIPSINTTMYHNHAS